MKEKCGSSDDRETTFWVNIPKEKKSKNDACGYQLESPAGIIDFIREFPVFLRQSVP